MYQMIMIDTKNMQSAFTLYKCKIDYAFLGGIVWIRQQKYLL